MAKKKETKAKAKAERTKQPHAVKPTRRPARAPAPDAAQATAPEATTASAPRVPDPRLPPPGTVIEKHDRGGALRCKCTVEEGGGIRYAGKLYKSLSAAALAAARDLGIEGKSFNGYVWWGLSKPLRPVADLVEALGRAWERYRERATSVVGSVKEEERERVRELLDEHAEAIKGLRGKVA